VTGAELDAALAADPAISHVVVCHVDTGTGLLNPIAPLAEVARRRGVALIVDAIASFGGLPIDAEALDLEAIVLSPNKWLEGLPGISLVVAKRAALEAAAGRSHSFCLDLHRQWRGLESDGRWRFTPPAQTLAALVAALRQHERRVRRRGSRGSGATGAAWSAACARSALRPICATRSLPRSSRPSTSRPIHATTARACSS
jgi:2-aminoethylphosphonate-pyruvate transaminase